VQQGESQAMVQNIDFVPTFLDLAGIGYDVNDYDGRSMKPILETGSSFDVDREWRQTLIIEYNTIKETDLGAGFGSCRMWDSNDVDSQNPFGQTVSQLPDNYILDNIMNSWKILRIRNSSHNIMYGEFGMTADVMAGTPTFKEFYDLNEDPWQLHNKYYENTMDDAVSEWMHAMLWKYAECDGADSCSPIGGDAPSDYTPVVVVENNENNGGVVVVGNGGGKSGGNKGGKSNKAAAYTNEENSDQASGQTIGHNYHSYQAAQAAQAASMTHFSYAEVELVVMFAVIAFLSLSIGIFIGKRLPNKSQNMPKKNIL